MFKTKKGQPAIPPGERTFTSAEVARVAGVSLRQLQWWDERKVVSPHHEGHKRLYRTEEVVEVTVIAELRKKGFSLQKIRRVLRFLQRELGKSLPAVIHGEGDLHLITDGKTIYLEQEPQKIVDLLKGAKQAMFLVCVTDQVKRLTLTPRKPVRSEIAVSPAKKVKAAI